MTDVVLPWDRYPVCYTGRRFKGTMVETAGTSAKSALPLVSVPVQNGRICSFRGGRLVFFRGAPSKKLVPTPQNGRICSFGEEPKLKEGPVEDSLETQSPWRIPGGPGWFNEVILKIPQFLSNSSNCSIFPICL